MRRLAAMLVLLLATGQQVFPQVKFACIGDSVTYGYGIADRDADSYPAQLAGLLGSGYEVRNFGHNGATLLRHGHRPYNTLSEYGDALAFRPDAVVIHLGLNDTDPRDWPDWAEDFVGDYLRLIADFKAVNPDVKVWICKMTPIFHGHKRFLSGTRDWHAEIQKRITLVAQAAGTGLIDLYSPLVTRPDLFADNLHPSEEGAGILARTVYGALTGDYGGLTLSGMYSDGMVLQRGKELTLRGIADRGTRVGVELVKPASGRVKEKVVCSSEAVAGNDGSWNVSLPALDAGGPYVLKIGNLNFRDVWVGEVWVCAGQSNMEFKLKDCATAEGDLEEAARRNDIHLFHMKPRWVTNNVEWSPEALAEINRLRYFDCQSWSSADASAAGEFSAVGYHFGRVLADSLGCHVGIVSCAVGGSTTESWCDRELLQWKLPQILYDWYHGDFGQAWARERALRNISTSPDTRLQRHPYEPGYLFDAAIRTIGRFPVRGILWYQGESNAHNIELHEALFPIAVSSWRQYWGDELPVETVQLSGMDRPSWPRFRDSQRRLADCVPKVGMTVCSDLGARDNVHPVAKKPVGERAARSALHSVYGFSGTIPTGPVYVGFTREGSSLRLHFERAEGMSVSGGFELAGADGIYQPACASVSGNCIVVRSPEIVSPLAVRYAWKGFPEDADLRNGAGLPASTFCDESLLWDTSPF